MTERLVVRGVSKAFGPTQALDAVSLSVAPGEVHAIIGENGAGKSTLMKILAGALGADSGQLLLDGEAYMPTDPAAARRAGMAIVYQEAPLCEDMTVGENVLLGIEPARWDFIRRAQAREQALEVLREVEAEPGDLDPARRLRDLSPSARQLVTIARALAQSRCRVLMLDEPTASLSADDVQRLFRVINRLKQRGISILYISHFLEEVEQIADAYTVMRDGGTVARGRMQDVTISELVSRMAGRRVEQMFPRSERVPGERLLAVNGLAGETKPEQASLELFAGEVLGIAGLLGSGRTELLRCIFGLDRVRRGEIRVASYGGRASPTRRLAEGVGLLSEDRKNEGLALDLSVAENLTLSRLRGLGPGFFVLPQRQHEETERWIDRLGIITQGPRQAARHLSGGNQQKVALARLLYHDVDVLLLDEPTRGIDVHSRAQIYELIDQLAVRGKAVLVVSSYLPELLGICDRVAVMRRGKLGKPHDARKLDEHTALMEATGT